MRDPVVSAPVTSDKNTGKTARSESNPLHALSLPFGNLPPFPYYLQSDPIPGAVLATGREESREQPA